MKLYGKRPVLERLKVNPRSIKKIYLEKGPDLGQIVQAIKSSGISYESLGKAEFEALSGNLHAQGVLAEVENFSYRSLGEVLSAKNKPRLDLVCLDSLTDPQNLGSILRSLACLGSFGLILPKHRSAEITEAVLRVACGGENYVPVVKVTNLSQTLDKIKEAGYTIIGAVLEDGEDLRKAALAFPLCLVVGSEGKGIRQGLLSHLERKLTIPMPEGKFSFNAAVATAIICYEIRRQSNSLN